MLNADKKPFIPTDRPKSWVVFIIAVLSGLLIGGPVLFAGTIYGLSFLRTLGMIIFVGAWAIGFVMWSVYAVGTLRGKYSDLTDQPWSEQLW